LKERIERDPIFEKDTEAFEELAKIYIDNLAKCNNIIDNLNLDSSKYKKSTKKDIKDMLKNKCKVAMKIEQKIQLTKELAELNCGCGCGCGESEKPPKVETELDRLVKAKAQEIIKDGKAFEYIYDVWQPRVKGNPLLGRVLICSRGVQSCTNTKGLHIWAQGKHGQGKSHGIEAMVILLPEDRIKDGDVSPKVLYYMQENGLILPGTTVSIDDIELSGPLSVLFKKMTTRYQAGAEQRIVIDGEVLELKMPPRLAIWTSSVDMQGDEQLKDRFLFVLIDEKQTAAIIDFMKDKDRAPQSDGDKEFENAVCQGLFSDLASKTFHVDIPFSDDFEIRVSEGTRGYGIFSDMIKGLAALRYAKREKNDQGHLLATYHDFYDAKDLYEGLMGHSDMKFSTSEQEVLSALIKQDGRTANIKELSKKTDKSESRLREILSGRSNDEQKRYGLLAKCPSLTVDYETIITRKKGERVSYKRNVYTLDTKFELLDGKINLISVISDTDLASHKPKSEVKDSFRAWDSRSVESMQQPLATT